MAFIRVSGKQNIESWAKTASVAIANGALTYIISGGVNAADSTSGDHLGICMETVASTDATTRKIMIDVAGENDVFEVGVATSTVATLAALVGTYIDLTSSVVADATASAKDALLVVGVKDASTVLVKIASRINILRTATT